MSEMPSSKTSTQKYHSLFKYDAENKDVSLFMQHIAWGLRNSNAQIPEIVTQDLGDRSKYIGASAATGCLRKAFLDVGEKKEHSAKQMFVFERGHQLEEMIRKGANGNEWDELKSIEDYKSDNGIQYVHQHTAIAENSQYPFLKAHIDFIFVGENELVIKEIKSSASIPDSPYESHLFQTMIQTWLVKQQFPDKKIRASVVYHNWDTGQSKDYIVKFNLAIFEVAINKAQALWNAFQEKIEPEATTQLYCGKCPFKGSCPKINDGAFTDLPRDLIPIAKKLAGFRAVEKDIKKLKNNFMSLLKATEIKSTQLDDINIKVVEVKGKKVIAIDRLRDEHKELYDSLLEESGGYSFLKIT